MGPGSSTQILTLFNYLSKLIKIYPPLVRRRRFCLNFEILQNFVLNVQTLSC